jgi:hypothetical protein
MYICHVDGSCIDTIHGGSPHPQANVEFRFFNFCQATTLSSFPARFNALAVSLSASYLKLSACTSSLPRELSPHLSELTLLPFSLDFLVLIWTLLQMAFIENASKSTNIFEDNVQFLLIYDPS